MMDSSGDECVHLALEVIPDLVSVDAGAAAAVCGHLAPRVLALWGVNMRDPMLGEACMDALEAFAKLPSCNPQLEVRSGAKGWCMCVFWCAHGCVFVGVCCKCDEIAMCFDTRRGQTMCVTIA